MKGASSGRELLAAQINAGRFWSKVAVGSASECWIWQAAVNSGGYGTVGLVRERGTVLAHRAAYALVHGYVSARLVVRHSCDVRLCCNPEHLELGTQLDNVRDCWTRERHREVKYGERHPGCKITDAVVLEMRALHAQGVSGYELGRRFGCSGEHAKALATSRARSKAGA